MVWAECLSPTPLQTSPFLVCRTSMSSEAAAFEALVESARLLVVANAPAQSRDAPGEDAARVLSLDGRWRAGRRAVGRMAWFLA